MRAVGTLGEICTDDHADLARLSVGLRGPVACSALREAAWTATVWWAHGALTTEASRRTPWPARRRRRSRRVAQLGRHDRGAQVEQRQELVELLLIPPPTTNRSGQKMFSTWL